MQKVWVHGSIRFYCLRSGEEALNSFFKVRIVSWSTSLTWIYLTFQCKVASTRNQQEVLEVAIADGVTSLPEKTWKWGHSSVGIARSSMVKPQCFHCNLERADVISGVSVWNWQHAISPTAIFKFSFCHCSKLQKKQAPEEGRWQVYSTGGWLQWQFIGAFPEIKYWLGSHYSVVVSIQMYFLHGAVQENIFSLYVN